MKKLLIIVLLLCSTTIMVSPANALTLQLLPIGPFCPSCSGDVFLGVRGLTDGGPPSLGAFSLDIIFNEAVLQFQSVSFLENLGAPDTDFSSGIASPFESEIFVDDTTPGKLHIEEVSLLFDTELDDLQASNIGLAFVTFRVADQLGLSTDLSFGEVVLSDALGNVFQNPELLGSNISIQQPVPEPSTFILLGVSMLAMVGLRMRNKL